MEFGNTPPDATACTSFPNRSYTGCGNFVPLSRNGCSNNKRRCCESEIVSSCVTVNAKNFPAEIVDFASTVTWRVVRAVTALSIAWNRYLSALNEETAEFSRPAHASITRPRCPTIRRVQKWRWKWREEFFYDQNSLRATSPMPLGRTLRMSRSSCDGRWSPMPPCCCMMVRKRVACGTAYAEMRSRTVEY